MDLLISAPYKDRDDITPKVKARMVEIKARKPKTWEQRMLEKSRERYQQRVERMERLEREGGSTEGLEMVDFDWGCLGWKGERGW